MANESRNRLWLTKQNQHLADIFFDDCYLELGNISFDALNELLKKKLVHYQKLSYFKIIESGIGSFNVTNPVARKLLPFLHFYNLATKNKATQLVITYGILVRRKGYKETFIPMILIPVNLYFYKNEIYFQMVSRPMENPLLKADRKLDTEFIPEEKLDSVYELDNFCMSYVKHQTINVRLESYLSFINTRQQEIQLSHEKFSLESMNIEGIYNHYAINTNNDTYMITPLNQQQRYAVERAHCGNSFAITGYEGSGKTTTLISIASDAIYNGKRVMYISNSNETLDFVYDVFREKNLEAYVASFQQPFEKLYEKYHEVKKEQILDRILKAELAKKYQDVSRYENLLSKRILNFPFIEILKELIICKDLYQGENFNDKILERCNLLYRHEINEVLNSLKVIDLEMPRLISFKESHFINIPVNHQLKSTEQPINLLTNIHDAYVLLEKDKKLLEKKYGFHEIFNYARFKNIIIDFRNINRNDIPKSWLIYQDSDDIHISLNNFGRAKNLFDIYKNEVYEYQELEFYLNKRYDLEKVKKTNIKKMMNKLFGAYFTSNDEKAINYLLNEDINIYNKIRNMDAGKIYDSFYQFNKLLNLNINLNDDQSINEVLDFLELLGRGLYSKNWLDIKNNKKLHDKIASLETYLDHYYSALDIYQSCFDSLDNIDEAIKILLKKQKNDGSMSYYKKMDINVLLQEVIFVKENKVHIPKLLKEYQEVSYMPYEHRMSILLNFDEFIIRFNNIKDTKMQERISDVIINATNTNILDIMKATNSFKSLFTNSLKTFDFLEKHQLLTSSQSIEEKVVAISNIMNYIEDIIRLNHQMKELLRDNKEIVTFDTFIILQNKYSALNDIHMKIENNTTYKYLYGDIYMDYTLSVPHIGRLLNDFELYVDLFKNAKSLCNSFEDSINKKIDDHFSKSEIIINEINDYFKLYCKIFKDSVSKYYYDSFSVVIAYFDSLKNAEEQLDAYLIITDQMKVLIKYKLYALNGYIIEHNNEQFTARFRYGYYKTIYEKFIKDYPELLNTKEFEKLLEETMFLESDLLESNVEMLRMKRNNRFSLNNFSNLNYNQFIVRSSGLKQLILSDTQIVNNFVNIDFFDLIIIDDAHRLHANEYGKAILGKQVIIAGMEQQHASVSKSLISRIRPNNIMNFKYRFVKTPFTLLQQMNNIRGRFYSQVSKNDGIIILNHSYTSIINDIFKENKNARVNFFTASINKMHAVITNISQIIFPEESNKKVIWDFFTKQFNICDLQALYGGYFLDADYNILDLESYAKIEDEYASANMADALLVCRKKLIIIDYKHLVTSENPANFVKQIKQVIDKTTLSYNFDFNDITNKMAIAFENYNIKSFGAYGNFSLIINYNNYYFGIMILEDPYKTEFAILNEYREFKTSEFPTLIIWITDLIIDFDATIKRVVKEIGA